MLYIVISFILVKVGGSDWQGQLFPLPCINWLLGFLSELLFVILTRFSLKLNVTLCGLHFPWVGRQLDDDHSALAFLCPHLYWAQHIF